ncbi:PREDICTED: F-box protein At2g38590-like [Camelina sativa]|uniref:F-box protein At2g38590-like n=1 Tax=Camelina sativa TaxID=90675 RepID=A0ABM0T783_CAMSA|nr:PREDICTED: F-box protein At2g38590-like [Camelina sativa]
MDRFFYALGYFDKKSQSCRRHKLFRFTNRYHQADPEKHFFWYEIYDFTAKRNDENFQEVLVDCIICFDFTSESFGPLMPLPVTGGRYDYTSLSRVREEKFAVLLQQRDSMLLDLWISTKIETEEVLWSKFLRVETAGFNIPFISGSFFIDEEKKLAFGSLVDKRHKVIVIGEANYRRVLNFGREFGDEDGWLDLCSYVPSSVQINQPAEREGKIQSDLEKRRYDENMSRLVSLGFYDQYNLCRRKEAKGENEIL